MDDKAQGILFTNCEESGCRRHGTNNVQLDLGQIMGEPTQPAIGRGDQSVPVKIPERSGSPFFILVSSLRFA